MTTSTKPRRTRKTTQPTTVEEWATTLTAATTPVDQAKAMKAMRERGASDARMAECMGVTAMTARSRFLKVQGQIRREDNGA